MVGRLSLVFSWEENTKLIVFGSNMSVFVVSFRHASHSFDKSFWKFLFFGIKDDLIFVVRYRLSYLNEITVKWFGICVVKNSFLKIGL